MIASLYILLLIFAVSLIYILVTNKKKPVSDKNAQPFSNMPGHISFPLVGTTWTLFGMNFVDGFAQYHKMCREVYPEPLRTVLGSWPAANIFKDEHFETILTSQIHITKSSTYSFLHPWLGQGLLTSTGSKWHSRRKLITPAFHFKILDGFSEIFFEKTNTLIQKLKEIPANQQIDITPYVTKCTLDIICETAMGVSVNAQSESHNKYAEAIHNISHRITDRIMRPWLHPQYFWYLSQNYRDTVKCVNTLHGFTYQVIKERRAELENKTTKIDSEDNFGQKRRMAFLDMLLQATSEGIPLSNEEIREEVDTFMFEGHDTTTAAISWAISLLGNHSDVQDKIYAELTGILQGSDRPFTKADLAEMKYLEMTIKETLRLYPSVPILGRILSQDLKVGNYICPKDTLIGLNVFLLHRDPANFPNPEKFDPDRFLPDVCAKRHPFAYVPFSAGPRNCIGQKFAMMEEKIILSSILRNFKIVAHETPDNFKPMGVLILRFETGCPITLVPRK